MPQCPKPFIRCNQAFLKLTLSLRRKDGRAGDYKLEHAQQASCDFELPLIAGTMESNQDLAGEASGGARWAFIRTEVIGGPSADCVVLAGQVLNETINGVRIAHQNPPYLNWIFPDDHQNTQSGIKYSLNRFSAGVKLM
jgi:hypothetical protein